MSALILGIVAAACEKAFCDAWHAGDQAVMRMANQATTDCYRASIACGWGDWS